MNFKFTPLTNLIPNYYFYFCFINPQFFFFFFYFLPGYDLDVQA